MANLAQLPEYPPLHKINLAAYPWLAHKTTASLP